MSIGFVNKKRSTVKALNSEQKAFILFSKMYEVPCLPVSGDTLVLFATWLVSSGRLSRASSVKQYLSAVSTMHRMHGLRCDTPKTYGPLDNTVQGIRRRFSGPVRKMEPVTPEILFNLISWPCDIYTTSSTVSWDQQIILNVVQVLFIVAFFSMLRCSNLVADTFAHVDKERQLTWGRIKRFPGGIVISVVLSKTIQFKERVHQVALPAQPDSMFCPVKALDRLVQLRGAENCGPTDLVFAVPGHNGWVPLLKHTVVKILKAQVKRMNLNPDEFGFHGIRHGAIHIAVIAEPSLELIRVQSDHVSDAIHAYTSLPGSRRFSAAHKVGQHMLEAERSLVRAVAC